MMKRIFLKLIFLLFATATATVNAQIMSHQSRVSVSEPPGEIEIASDNFNRSALGTDWTQTNPYNGSIAITGDTAFYGSGVQVPGNGASAVWTGSGTFSADQYSKISAFGFAYQTTSYHIGVIVRSSTDTDSNRDYYGFIVCANRGGSPYDAYLVKVVNGTVTNLNTGQIAVTNWDTIKLSVQGSTLRCYVNDVALGGNWEQTDSDLSTGNPGIAGSGGASYMKGDNWSGGDM